MISNERFSPFQRQPYHQPYAPQPPRPFVQEDTLASRHVQIERKLFVLTLKENPRGRFLRISEETSGRRNTIIIPSTGLVEFRQVLAEMVKAANENFAESEPAAAPAAAIKPSATVTAAVESAKQELSVTNIAETRSPQIETKNQSPELPDKPKRKMSVAARAKISAAAKARWAKAKAATL
jgi:flagellar hook-basal body complex protein FliE